MDMLTFTNNTSQSNMLKFVPFVGFLLMVTMLGGCGSAEAVKIGRAHV